MENGILIFDLVNTLVKAPSCEARKKLNQLNASTYAKSDSDSLKEDKKESTLIDISGYRLWKDTMKVLKLLKNKGYCMILAINSSNIPKTNKIIDELGDETQKLRDIFHRVFISGELGIKKPDPNFIHTIISILGENASAVLDKTYIIGDMLDKDIACGINAGIKSIWLDISASDQERNIEAINSGRIKYPRTISSLSLLESAIEFYEPLGIKAGYIIPTAKKREIIGMKGCFASSNKVWYNFIDPYADFSQIGSYDVIVHKAVDLLSMKKAHALSSLRLFIDQHPDIKIIDSLECIEYLLKRGDMYKKLQETIGSGIFINEMRLRLPWQIDILQPSPDSIPFVRNEMESHSINFPLLVKTDQSSVSDLSHFMCVVFDFEGLITAFTNFQEKLILQEYINHDKTVYKVYALGEDIRYFSRPSCSNLVSGQGVVSFRSDQPWPQSLKSEDKQIIRDLSMEIVRLGAQIITNSLKITIFGYDILVQSHTNDYIIVDLNVFPGFKEYSNLSEVMDQHIINTLKN
ncbi:unnamed protein product [Blepharisma stoltei]|uniref:inositol-1,3,4-trisphosphate 5/6-kinase n=1 Tax=Blepharisma stoltei TaxID=1481888 RepID=A0AAU9IX02_9CILI|nr:unnamed protein product [Blepharisma stoltei]